MTRVPAGVRALWLLVMLAGVSCTKTVVIAPSEYADHPPASSYRVHTTDGNTYYVSRYTATDSTLVVLGFRYVKDRPQPPERPFSIPLAEVKSVEHVEPGIGVPIVVIALALIVVGIGAAAAAGGW